MKSFLTTSKWCNRAIATINDVNGTVLGLLNTYYVIFATNIHSVKTKDARYRKNMGVVVFTVKKTPLLVNIYDVQQLMRYSNVSKFYSLYVSHDFLPHFIPE